MLISVSALVMENHRDPMLVSAPRSVPVDNFTTRGPVLVSVATLVMENRPGPVLVLAPSNVSLDDFAAMIGRTSNSIVQRHNEALALDSPNRTQLRIIIRVYNHRQEKTAFQSLLREADPLSIVQLLGFQTIHDSEQSEQQKSEVASSRGGSRHVLRRRSASSPCRGPT